MKMIAAFLNLTKDMGRPPALMIWLSILLGALCYFGLHYAASHWLTSWQLDVLGGPAHADYVRTLGNMAGIYALLNIFALIYGVIVHFFRTGRVAHLESDSGLV